MAELQQIIKHLKTDKTNTLFKFIIDVDDMVEVLEDISKIIGLASFKTYIVRLFKSFAISYKDNNSVLSGSFLNMTLFGPPGSGKTECGKLLARFYDCIDFTNKPSESSKEDSSESKEDFKRLENVTVSFYETIPRKPLHLFTENMRLKRIINNVSHESVKMKTIINRLRKKSWPHEQKEFAHLNAFFKKLQSHMENVILPGIVPENGVTQLDNELPVKFDDKPFIVKEDQSSSRNSNYIRGPSMKNPNIFPVGHPFFQRGNAKQIKLKMPERKKKEPNFAILSRADIIEKYQGHSGKKVKELINKYRNGTIFVDEAYSLCIDSKDTFGMEVITEITNDMDKNPQGPRWIFAGYKNSLENTIFKFQPGLRRRIAAHITINSYSPDELTSIFLKQLKDANLELDETVTRGKITSLFRKSSFPDLGGSTKNAVDYLKDMIYFRKYDNIFTENTPLILKITLDDIRDSLTTIVVEVEKDEPPMSMYR